MSRGNAFNILLHYAGNGLITIRLRDVPPHSLDLSRADAAQRIGN